jgi:hypothetical protein
MKYYYANAENKPTGPVDLAELGRLAASGVINNNTAVIADGSQTWTTYGAVKDTSGTAAVADAVAATASQAVRAARQYSWGAFFYALLLIVIEWFCLPWTVLRRSGIELAEWGTQRALPTASSDQPVLTYMCVAFKPFVHVAFTTIAVIQAIRALFGAGFLYHTYAGYTYGFDDYKFGAAAAACVGALFAAYFGNLVIAFLFEIWGLLIRVANDVKRIAGRN